MRTKTLWVAPALALGAMTMWAAPAIADTEDSWSGQASLEAMNDSGTSGEATLELHGSEATVTIDVSGAAETFMDGPFPHAQHIHIAGEGVCPGPDADENGDGAVSTVEGHHYYGEIGTSLTTEGDTSADSALAIDRFPGGDAYTYERTFELNDDTAKALAEGTAVVVVHGVDPANLSDEAAEAMSELDPELPLAATLPAACGEVAVSQMGQMPEEGADTGSPVQTSDDSDLALGTGIGALAVVVLGGGVWAVRRHSTRA
ncbi:MAG TPA: hypothetical protein H9815_05665 [Candidatus Ruania gallistercoris]|uniref:CHRD domain-containing protein n=1 Tax=Candidatus Ruania gallistercoris TaxID=2838746 RepID=A0A9D2J4E5_9MICO|nr:hypothetical protein [Candidatus Ruania gallistercoris]